ncbi:MAG: diguanylate cyclase [Hyphomicrobium sp.]
MPRPSGISASQHHRGVSRSICASRTPGGERAIALAQAGIALFVVLLHAFGFRRSLSELDPMVLSALAALLCSSAVRWRLAAQRPLPERFLDVLSVIDVAIVLTLIWSYQYAFGLPAAGVLKAPAFVLLLLLVGLRALRFHPRPVIVTGIAAVAAGSLLVCSAVLVDGWDAITDDYNRYLSSFHIFIPAEVQRLSALAGLVVVLAVGAYGARRVLGRGGAFGRLRAKRSTQRASTLRKSSRARAHAESAIAALDRRDAELSEQNRFFNAALSNMPQGLCMFDQDQKLLVCNDRYVEMYGLSKDLARRGTPFNEIIESRINNGLYEGRDAEAYLEERFAAVRETVRHTKVHDCAMAASSPSRTSHWRAAAGVATHDDVTYLHRIEARLSYLARHDALTDLPNRAQLRERLDELLKGDTLARGYIIVLVFEIDRFKETNDTFGPSIGDALLQNMAQRLRRRLDGVDTIARVGGDEFIVLQTAEEPAIAADALAKRLHAVLGTSFDIDATRSRSPSASASPSLPVDGDVSDELLKKRRPGTGKGQARGPRQLPLL